MRASVECTFVQEDKPRITGLLDRGYPYLERVERLRPPAKLMNMFQVPQRTIALPRPSYMHFRRLRPKLSPLIFFQTSS